MRHKNISLELIKDSFVSYNPFEEEDSSSSSNNKLVLKQVMNGELTEKQLTCISLYFGSGYTMEEIGERLGVGKSTVSKHISKAKTRIKKCLDYAHTGKNFYLRQ